MVIIKIPYLNLVTILTATGGTMYILILQKAKALPTNWYGAQNLSVEMETRNWCLQYCEVVAHYVATK